MLEVLSTDNNNNNFDTLTVQKQILTVKAVWVTGFDYAIRESKAERNTVTVCL